MKAPWPHFLAEFLGTAVLVGAGLSVVIVDFGTGSPILDAVPEAGARRAITGFLFGTVGALVAVSPLGRISGAHINPVVTLAFWRQGRMTARNAAGYALAQLAGAVLGALPLLAWGRVGASVDFGATVPGAGYGKAAALLGEVATTFALVVGLLFFVSRRSIRKFTPLLFPFLYCAMVWLEAPVSGTSTNPARSLGPAVVSGQWQAWWIYWVGPAAGALLGVSIHRLGWLGLSEVEVAKLFHFEEDRYGIFRRKRPRD